MAEKITISHELSCPECTAPMVLKRNTESRYPRSGKPRRYYRCSKYPRCTGSCGAHPDGTPLGFPGDAKTKQARINLHQIFDGLWMVRGWTRNEAYYILQILMGMGEEKAHIGNFSAEDCAVATVRIQKFLSLNESVASNPCLYSLYRFILFPGSCTKHGEDLHQVYLQGRETFCMECLEGQEGPVWEAYLRFQNEIDS